MNVFEDLLEELKDENLLEQTVIDLPRVANVARNNAAVDFAPESKNSGPVSNGAKPSRPESDLDTPIAEKSERDFYRKRAIDEVSSLQMVEHILSGIEREHMKMMPASYDDLEAKKALHKFLQIQGDSTTTEYAEAEFQLMHETETWNSAASRRDKKISVANLRRFCENSRPVLSSQALLALGRFYRNAAYSELTRAKFEFVMTRLFSRETEGEKRRVLFGRSEMIEHIRALYANWASVALYSADQVPLKTRAIVAGFEDRVAEAESAITFDQLIQNDFFKKVHEFKEATGEMFFTPEVVAAMIECNTKIGNKFVDLVRLERERTNGQSVEQKYGYEYDQIISEAAGKTLQLVELLKSLPNIKALHDDSNVLETKKMAAAPDGPMAAAPDGPKEKKPLFTWDMFQVNKWLLAVTIGVVLASTGLYFWSSQSSSEGALMDAAHDVSLENTEFKEYLRSGRATDETFYAITLPAWDQLADDRKKEVLQQALAFATKNGKKNVQLVNVKGRNVAFASKTKSELLSLAP